jgi:putative ABC transport system substrate-binding protein
MSPLQSTLAQSQLSAAGGNITGFSNFEASLVEKRLDLLKELASRVGTVGVILNPQNAASAMFLRRAAMRSLPRPSADCLGARIDTQCPFR